MPTGHVVVLSNDVIPGMGMPVAAPGLRAWGLAQGLRYHGYFVTIAIIDRPVDLAWKRALPPPTPPDTFVGSPTDVGAFVRTHAPDVLVVTNSNHVHALGDLGHTHLVYDFFAPKMLELQYEAMGDRRDERLRTLRARKLSALASCDAVLVNGAKKVPYVEDWLERAGRRPGDIPVEVVNMPVPARLAERRPDDRLRAVVSGYIQPWSKPGEWVDALWPVLESGRLHLDLLVMHHWGQRAMPAAIPQRFAKLLDHPAVSAHSGMEFGDFQTFLSTRDLSIDLFSHNEERELAMVTRTVVSLACGLPVLHVPFTECSPLIDHYGAGWLVDGDDIGAVASTLNAIISDPEELLRRRDGARRVAREVFDPAVSTRPLARSLEQIL